jgi:hypothetical protein
VVSMGNSSTASAAKPQTSAVKHGTAALSSADNAAAAATKRKTNGHKREQALRRQTNARAQHEKTERKNDLTFSDEAGASVSELVEIVKISANLPEDLAVGLRDYTKSAGKTFTQGLKESIALKLYIENLVRDGATLVIEQPGRRQRELVFRL